MARSLSMSELTKLYSGVNKPPPALVPKISLSGSTVKDKLSKLYYSRETSSLGPLPSALATTIPASQQTTVAICLVIVDTLHHESIWRHWLEQGVVEGAQYKARLFIHAKFPEKVSSPWVRERCLPLSYMPEWNSPEVIRAMLSVLSAALQDPHCGRFVFGTESCVPMYSLQESAALLFREDRSWLNAFNQPKSSWEKRTCFSSVNSQVVPAGAVWKAIPGWVMLNRRHAADVSILCEQSLYLGSSSSNSSSNSSVSIDTSTAPPERKEGGGTGTGAAAASQSPLLRAAVARGPLPATPADGILGGTADADLVRSWGTGQWSEDKVGVWAPEEVFFATMLCLLGYIKDSAGAGAGAGARSTDQVKRQMATYAAFSKVGEANPIAYDDFTPQLISKFRQTGAVFARKFSAAAVDLPKWTNVMQTLASASASATAGKGTAGAAAAGSIPRSTFPIAAAISATTAATTDPLTKQKHEASAPVAAAVAGTKTAPPLRPSGFPLSSSASASAQTQLHLPTVSATAMGADATEQETSDPVLKKARRDGQES